LIEIDLNFIDLIIEIFLVFVPYFKFVMFV
jgi:hypothetical protein